MNSNNRLTLKRRGGLVLSPEGLAVLNGALKKWWDSPDSERKSPQQKLTQFVRWTKLNGEGDNIDLKTVNSIFRRQPAREVKIQFVFDALGIPFSRERHCVSPDAASGNLERQPPSSIGREADVTAIKTLLESSDLVTLTGPGGVGKTWLAKRVGKEMERYFADAVWLVELEGLPTGAEESLVLQKIATALKIQEESSRPLIDTVSASLRDRQLLLILDNCEHLRDTCATLTRKLLQSSTFLRVLTTSREILDMEFERCYVVPPLAVPDLKRFSAATGDIAMLLGYDAVRHFVEQARKPGFELVVTQQNASVLARICQRLDGIPLALELAAARARALSLSELEAGLKDRFRLLTGGNRFTPARQRSLQATLDWSYNLLDAQEQALLGHLSLFAEGCSREAVEFVCGAPAEAASPDRDAAGILDLLTSLRDKSLVYYREEEGRARYHLLETVRQYGWERFVTSGDSDTVRGRHRDYFLTLAEQAEQELTSPQQIEWLRRLEAEHENFRIALEWSLSRGETRESLRFCCALVAFWKMRGYCSEGRKWCARALAMPEAREWPLERAKALQAAGEMARYQSDYATARSCYEESLSLWREMGDRTRMGHLLNRVSDTAIIQGDFLSARARLEESMALCQADGDRKGLAGSLRHLGDLFYHQGDIAAALSHFEQALTICQDIEDRRGIVHSLNGLASVTLARGDYGGADVYFEKVLALNQECGTPINIAHALRNKGTVLYCQGAFGAAVRYLEESLAIYRGLEERQGIAYSLCMLANTVHSDGDSPTAVSYLEESLAMFRTRGDQGGISYALSLLANIACSQGDYTAAQTYLIESLTLYRKIGYSGGLADLLSGFAGLAARTRKVLRAAVLWGVAEVLREKSGFAVPSHLQAQYPQDVAAVRQILGEEAFAAAWGRGRGMTQEEAIAFALEESDGCF